MGGGDLNSKKAWHPNTLKNQERVWKAEQAAAEEKKRISELERERLLERDRAELNKLAKSNLVHSGLTGDDRLHWMYEKPDKKVQQEEYLLGKAIDKNHEQAGKSEADEIPAVSRRVVGSSMLTVSGDTQVDLQRKLREDPLLLVKERERAARAALLNNPVQRARLTELLRREQKTMKESKPKKKKKKSKDLDNILAEKLHALSSSKGIDLASLLASDDSSSESSDETSKIKKKKNKKKSRSKHDVKLDNSVIEDRRSKSKYDIKKNPKNNSCAGKLKRDSTERERVNTKTKRRKSSKSIERESDKSHTTRHHRGYNEYHQPSDDSASSDNGSKKLNSLVKPKSAAVIVDTKRKKRLHSVENESAHVKKHHRDSNDDHQPGDDQQSIGDRMGKTSKSCGTEDRYWSNIQYENLRNGQYSRDECQSKDGKYRKSEQQSKTENNSGASRYKYQREDRNRDVGSYRSSRNFREERICKDENDKEQTWQNPSLLDKSWRNKKRSGLSETEKATKLAEMVAAGAEREKQRERRVADQLAQKETEDPSHTHSRSRNVIRQLPDSLESRLHSNRHYIQRDQKHMNENFARR